MNEMRIFETLFDMLPFGVYVTDVDTLDIIYMNDYFKKRFENYEGKKCYNIIYGNDSPCIFCKITELIENRKPKGNTVIFDNFNELEDKWYRIEEKSIFWPNGKLVKYSICVDITELKFTQNKLSESHAELLLKSKKIEENNKELKNLLFQLEESKKKDIALEKLRSLVNLSSGLAHHLNNINTPLLIISDKLSKNQIYPELKKEMEIIKDSVSKATKIIQGIIKFSQKAILNLHDIDISRFLTNYVKTKQATSDKIYNFHLNIDSVLNIKLSLDLELFSSCLDNIVKNSMESMPNGGDIEITCKHVKVKDSDFIKISITDHGFGIKDEYVDKVQDPFFTTKDYRNAFGLGLSESFGIISQHDGFIEISSQLDIGTTVDLFLPIKRSFK
ncbi:MAG: HAMP domain-containing histidine kinase [Calditerrivibrio sp.]|nr:HAMP domain-containing histidine kinase [Calditerrivibrio sp.]